MAQKYHGDGVVKLYQNCGFDGLSVALGLGEYNLSDLEEKGVYNDWISSIKVAEGFKVILYWDPDFCPPPVL